MAPLRECLPATVALDQGAAAGETVAAARAMECERLVVGTVGNVSARIPGGFLITPTRTPYTALLPGQLAYVEGDSAPSQASREWPLHAAIYRARPDVGSVVHTHSVHATAWSFLGEPLAPATEEIEYYGIGQVRTARHTAAGTKELGANAVDALRDSKAVLLARHGVVATGATPREAVTVAQAIEHQAHIAWLLRASIAPW
jgi:L-fuculose-phosphate aldolase